MISRYIPYHEGKKVDFFSTLSFEGDFYLKMGKKILYNRASLLFNKIFYNREYSGFLDSDFRSWEIKKEALGIGSNAALSPYELAQAVGFSKTPEEIRKELQQVPTRVIKGFKYKGETEGSCKDFEKQLGLFNSKKKDVSETPFTKALSFNAGVSQGYCVGTHSMMVVRMFDEHLAQRFSKNEKFNDIISIDEFRLFLMLHDIGKGLAVDEEGLLETSERKRKELRYCQDAIDKVVNQKIISEQTGNVFKALLADVTIGKFLVRNITQQDAVDELKKAMKDHHIEMDPEKFFSLCKIFHLADAGAYKNIRCIDGLFEVNAETKRMRHAKTTGNKNRQAGPKLQSIKDSLKASSKH
jgi:hypothetical protein